MFDLQLKVLNQWRSHIVNIKSCSSLVEQAPLALFGENWPDKGNKTHWFNQTAGFNSRVEATKGAMNLQAHFHYANKQACLVDLNSFHIRLDREQEKFLLLRLRTSTDL